MLSRLPWCPRPEIAAPAPKHLTPHARRRLVHSVAAICRGAQPSPFRYEAICRHALRAGLCLQGWSWHRADVTAGEIVGAGLRMIGAARPRWQQGQPEWTQEGFSPIEHTRCRECGRPLGDDNPNRIFCSAVCLHVWHSRQWRIRTGDEAHVYDFVVGSILLNAHRASTGRRNGTDGFSP